MSISFQMLLVQVTWTKCRVTRVVGSAPETGNVAGDPGTKGGIPGSFPLASLTWLRVQTTCVMTESLSISSSVRRTARVRKLFHLCWKNPLQLFIVYWWFLYYCCVYLFNESYEFKFFSAATIRGEGFLNTNYNPARGIDSGTSPCWCNYAGECSCFRPSSFSKVIPTSHITSKVEKKPPVRVRNPETTTGRLDFSDYPFTPKGTQ